MRGACAGLRTGGEAASPDTPPEKSDLSAWRPERLFRTCVSSLAGSDSFGRMMETEADSRGFFQARKQAYVCDGLPYNWTIQERHFPTFVLILDFAHAIERVYEAARAVTDGAEATWQCYTQWAAACWQGRVADAITYLQNNQSRMDYPRYRREGLPLTSAHMESLVKEINYRVKGTEKFWADGPSAEAILQLRAAAALCDDDRLTRHMTARPGNPFHPNVKATPAMSL